MSLWYHKSVFSSYLDSWFLNMQKFFIIVTSKSLEISLVVDVISSLDFILVCGPSPYSRWYAQELNLISKIEFKIHQRDRFISIQISKYKSISCILDAILAVRFKDLKHFDKTLNEKFLFSRYMALNIYSYTFKRVILESVKTKIFSKSVKMAQIVISLNI